MDLTRRGRLGTDGDSPAVLSLLVRFWWEPREIDGMRPVLRTYVRDLGSGVETYLPGIDALVAHLSRIVNTPLAPADDPTAGIGG
jgi:hypothetical protein